MASSGITHRSWTDRHGRLQERWDVEYYIDGRRKQETCYSEDEANQRLAEIKTDKRRGTYLDPSGGRIKLRAYSKEWLESKHFPVGTHMQVEMRLKVHTPGAGRPVDRPRPADDDPIVDDQVERRRKF